MTERESLYQRYGDLLAKEKGLLVKQPGLTDLYEGESGFNDLKRERKRLEMQLGYTSLRLNEIQTELQVLEMEHSPNSFKKGQRQYDADKKRERTESRRLAGTGFNIFVRSDGGNSAWVEVEGADAKVRDLLENYRVANHPALTGWLSFGGQPLKPDQSLSDIGIGPEGEVEFIESDAVLKMKNFIAQNPAVRSYEVYMHRTDPKVLSAKPMDQNGGETSSLTIYSETGDKVPKGYEEIRIFFSNSASGHRVSVGKITAADATFYINRL